MNRARSVLFVLCVVVSYLAWFLSGETVYAMFAICLSIVFIFCLSSAWLACALVQVKSSLPTKHVQRSEEIALDYTLQNGSPLPISCIVLTMCIPQSGNGTHALQIHALPPMRTQTFTRLLPCDYRGVFDVGITHVCACDLLGLFSIQKKISSPSDAFNVFVRPYISAVTAFSGGIGGDGASLLQAAQDTASYAGAKPYAQGDDIRRMHWKLTLRRQEFMVKHYESARRTDTLILLNCLPPDLTAPSRLLLEDRMAECAASYAHAQLLSGYPVRMPLYAQQPHEISGQTQRDFHAFLDALTTLCYDGSHPFDQVVTLESRRQSDGAVIIITTAIDSLTCDAVLRMQLSGMTVRLFQYSLEAAQDNLYLAQLRSAGVRVDCLSPHDPLPTQ